MKRFKPEQKTKIEERKEKGGGEDGRKIPATTGIPNTQRLLYLAMPFLRWTTLMETQEE